MHQCHIDILLDGHNRAGSIPQVASNTAYLHHFTPSADSWRKIPDAVFESWGEKQEGPL